MNRVVCEDCGTVQYFDKHIIQSKLEYFGLHNLAFVKHHIVYNLACPCQLAILCVFVLYHILF